MARYSSFKYGQRKYGTDSTITTLGWGLIIAWNGTKDWLPYPEGDYSGENEMDRATALHVKRGREFVLNPTGTGFEHYRPGITTVTLDNSDGRYDPFNANSPLYPNVSPGKFARLSVRDGSGTTYGIMRGVVVDIQPFQSLSTRQVVITIIDGLDWLSQRRIHVGLRGAFQADNLARVDVLQAADWPAKPVVSPADLLGEWPVGGNTITTTVNNWWAWGDNGLDAMNVIEDLSVGVFMHTRNGSALFIGGNESAILETIDVDESMLLRDISIRAPWEVVRNDITVVATPLPQFANTEVLWELQESIPINSGQVVSLEIFFTEGAEAVPTAINNFDPSDFVFTANTTSTGSGTDITSQITVTFSEFGTGMFVEFINNSTSNGFITSASCTPGSTITPRHKTARRAFDVDSQKRYGYKSLTLDLGDKFSSETYAQTVADYLLSKFKDPQPYPIIKVEQRPELQYLPDLYRYRFNLSLTSIGISGLFRIGGIEHEWLRENGQAVRTTFWLEPYSNPISI